MYSTNLSSAATPAATTSSTSHRHAPTTAATHAFIRAFASRVSHGFVHGENQARRFGGGVQGVDFHQARFPDEAFVRVADATSVDIDAEIRPVIARVLLSELVQHVGRVVPGIVAELSRDDF
jgi:hypothetical protein